MHNLGLKIDDTCNLNTFMISDASVYANTPIDNAILDVIPPSQVMPTYIMRVNKMFKIVLNSSILKISPANAVDFSPIPDGNYAIKYSVAPNQDVNIRYYYFRNLQQLFHWRDSVCNLYNNKCNISSKDFFNLRRELIFLKQDIDAAKFMAEDKHDVFKANELYASANSSLCSFDEKMTCYLK